MPRIRVRECVGRRIECEEAAGRRGKRRVESRSARVRWEMQEGRSRACHGQSGKQASALVTGIDGEARGGIAK